jgi:acetyl-CoA carboxylase carboxyl transferase subunit beta
MNPGRTLRRMVRSVMPDKMKRGRRALRMDDRRYVENKHACPSCRKHVDDAQLALNLYVCPHCGHHYRISALFD